MFQIFIVCKEKVAFNQQNKACFWIVLCFIFDVLKRNGSSGLACCTMLMAIRWATLKACLHRRLLLRSFSFWCMRLNGLTYECIRPSVQSYCIWINTFVTQPLNHASEWEKSWIHINFQILPNSLSLICIRLYKHGWPFSIS